MTLLCGCTGHHRALSRPPLVGHAPPWAFCRRWSGIDLETEETCRVEGKQGKPGDFTRVLLSGRGKRRSAPEGKESGGSRMEGRAVRAQVGALDGMKRKNGLSACLVREFWEFGYYSTFVFIWQLVFNHGLIRLKTFVSQFPTKLCN